MEVRSVEYEVLSKDLAPEGDAMNVICAFREGMMMMMKKWVMNECDSQSVDQFVSYLADVDGDQCIVDMDKLNIIGERCYATYGSEIGINNPLYVDDIFGIGNPMVIENTVSNLKLLEERKKLTLSNIKSVLVK